MSEQIPADDRITLSAEVERIGAQTLLEFGPGQSTRLFVGLGLRVTTLEYSEPWFTKACNAWAGNDAVTVEWYDNEPGIQVTLPQFDIAFVDSPVGDSRRYKLPGQEECSRLNTTLCALQHAPMVLLHDAHRPGEQATLERIREAGHAVTVHDTNKGVARIERC